MYSKGSVYVKNTMEYGTLNTLYDPHKSPNSVPGFLFLCHVYFSRFTDFKLGDAK